MPIYLAIKTHYDHRAELAPHLKFSTLPSAVQYARYLSDYRDKGTGGNGFHECLNFAVSETNSTKIYLPPTCLPATKRLGDEFAIFSFTYKTDPELPSAIIGIHGGVRILSNQPGGIIRAETEQIEGADPLHYHAEAPGDMVTLLTPPFPYNPKVGRHTPKYTHWGYGMRYIKPDQVGAILIDAEVLATARLSTARTTEQSAMQRELRVIRLIRARYGLGTPIAATTKSTGNNEPNAETGQAGERLVYDSEIEYVRSRGIDESRVEWISQVNPQSEYDILSVRKVGGQLIPRYIEVKTSTSEETNVYISSRQLDFFAAHQDQSHFTLLTLDRKYNIKRRLDLTLEELRGKYLLEPIKYKLAERIPSAP